MNTHIDKQDIEKWAEYLLNHSLGGMRPEDVVMVKGEHIAWPLLSVLQDKIFSAGAIADICLVPPDNNRGQVWGASIARHGTVEQIRRVPEWHRQRYENMTKYIEVLGAEDPSLYANLPAETSAALMKADEPFKSIRLLKPWVLTLYPTRGFADIEGLSLEEYTDIVVSASTTDPGMLEAVEEPIYRLMQDSRVISVRTQHPGTGRDLTLNMNIDGRFAVKCTGIRNFPDGEVFTSPDARTVDGEIFLDLPVYYNGVTLQGIYLKIENGIITDYTANREYDTLRQIIETDDGSHRIGEVALGMNSGLKKALKHPLFVEKVGGTLHIAIGASYPECFVDDPASAEGRQQSEEFFRQGSLNRSSQHVDIVVDFRPGGTGKEIYLDNTRLEIRNNIWTIPE